MSFISIQFLAFLTVLLGVYFLVPRKWQWKVIPLFSIWFYLSYGVTSIGFIAATTIITYFMGICLNREDDRLTELKRKCTDKEQKKQYKENCTKKKKRIMLAGLSVNFGIWAVLKYTSLFDFFPLGISIYPGFSET